MSRHYLTVLPMSPLYLISTSHIQTVLISKAHAMSVPHLYSQCPVCTSSLNPMPRQYLNVYSL